MEILYLKSVDSTQKFLKSKVESAELRLPLCVVTAVQTSGIGSRGNSWIGKEGNIFFSFAVNKDELPEDLPLISSSIYFSYIFKELLAEMGSSSLIKWPNDFYVGGKKIGGTVTELVKDMLICGIGINIIAPSREFGSLDIKVSNKDVIETFLKKVKKYPSWKEIFSKFSVEFERTKVLNTHQNGRTVSLKKAKLQGDGSLIIEGERVLSLR